MTCTNARVVKGYNPAGYSSRNNRVRGREGVQHWYYVPYIAVYDTRIVPFTAPSSNRHRPSNVLEEYHCDVAWLWASYLARLPSSTSSIGYVHRPLVSSRRGILVALLRLWSATGISPSLYRSSRRKRQKESIEATIFRENACGSSARLLSKLDPCSLTKTIFSTYRVILDFLFGVPLNI